MFASLVRKEVVVNGFSVRIRKLSGKSLEAARDARGMDRARYFRTLGGEIFEAIRDPTKVAEARSTMAKPESELTEDDLKARRESRYEDYDRQRVLVAGIVSWDARRDGKEVSLTEGIEDLDEETAECLKREILDLSLPPLTASEAREADTKDSAPSISS